MKPLILFFLTTPLTAVTTEVIPGDNIPWPRHTIDATSRGADGVKLGDFNGDGLADLVFTCENAHQEREGVVWLERQRDGPWKQHSVGGSEGVKFDLVQLLDLNEDGNLDIITCEERDQLGVVWYENPRQSSPRK